MIACYEENIEQLTLMVCASPATAFRETGLEEESNAAFRNFCHRSCKIDR